MFLMQSKTNLAQYLIYFVHCKYVSCCTVPPATSDCIPPRDLKLFIPADGAVGGSELQIDVKLIGPEGKLQLQLKRQGDTFVSDWSGQSLRRVRDDMFTVYRGSLQRWMKTSFL